MLPARRSSVSRPVIFMFWLVAVMTQLSLNHASNMIFGTGWFVTLGLALCSMFLVLAVRIPFQQALGLPGCLIVSALIFYVVIGAGVALVTDAEWRMTHYRLPFYVGLAVLVIVASASGSWVVLRRIGTENLLAGILVIKAVTCILILASPWLLEHLYLSLPQRDLLIQRGRFMGTFGGPNYAGIATCQTVVLALVLTNSRYRRPALWVAILGSISVLLTFSRTAFIILVLVVAFFLWSSKSNTDYKQRQFVSILFIVMFIAGILGIAIVNVEHLPLKQDEIDRILWLMNISTHEPAKSLNLRYEVWSVGMSDIVESPLFGHGLSQFHSVEHTPVECSSVKGEPISCGIHNVYMLFLGEAGIVPLVLFLLFIGALFRMYLVLPKSIAINTITGWTIILSMESMSAQDAPFLTWNAFIIGLSCAMAAYVVRESRGRRTERIPEVRQAPVRTAPDNGAG